MTESKPPSAPVSGQSSRQPSPAVHVKNSQPLRISRPFDVWDIYVPLVSRLGGFSILVLSAVVFGMCLTLGLNHFWQLSWRFVILAGLVYFLMLVLPRKPQRIVCLFGMALGVTSFISFLLSSDPKTFLLQMLGLGISTSVIVLLE
jgi:hypothetical protein